jgi:hypothetical protein
VSYVCVSSPGYAPFPDSAGREDHKRRGGPFLDGVSCCKCARDILSSDFLEPHNKGDPSEGVSVTPDKVEDERRKATHQVRMGSGAQWTDEYTFCV